MTIDFKNIYCFGFTQPKTDSWHNIVKLARGNSWKVIDLDKFQKTLNDNILETYESLVSFQFVDIDSDIEYTASFDNQKMKWKLQIPNSPDDAINEDDIKAFLDNETFKKLCRKADQILTISAEYCEFLIPEIRQGKFIELDEIKFEAIIHMLADTNLRKNLKFGKYI